MARFAPFSLIFRRLLGRKPRPAPIMVHQFAKVGSTSVLRELERVWRRSPVHHTHAFHDLEIIERQVREAMADPTAALAEVHKCRALRREFESWDGPPWKIITLVRDPVARSVSLMFHSIESFIPGFREKYQSGDVPLSQLRKIYDDHFAGDPSEWFDRQIAAPLGVDVYSDPFSTERGYQIYHGPRADVLLLRLEDLAACWGEAARAFLGVENSTIAKHNVTRDPNYNEDLKRSLITEEVVDRIYGTRVARHFYSEHELARFKSRWMTR